jgi:hypothetical protein
MKATSDNLTPERRAETDALAALPDNQINARHTRTARMERCKSRRFVPTGEDSPTFKVVY